MENKFEIVPSKKDMVIEFSQGLFNSLVIPEDYPEFISKSINIYDNPDFIDRQGADITVCATSDKDEIVGLSIEVRLLEAKKLETEFAKKLAESAKDLHDTFRDISKDELLIKISTLATQAESFYESYYNNELIEELIEKE